MVLPARRTNGHKFGIIISSISVMNVQQRTHIPSVIFNIPFATRCVEAGVDIKSLSEILGHGNVSVTLNTYVHSSLELKRTQLEKLVTLSA